MTSDSSATPLTLWETWLQHAKARPQDDAIVHWVAGEAPHRWTWAALIDRAFRYAACLKSMGVQPGQVCATILRHHREFYPIYMGIEAAGAIPAVLAYPNTRLHPDKFRQGIEGMARKSGLDFILTERELEPQIGPFIDLPGSAPRRILLPLDWESESRLDNACEIPHPRVDPAGPCLLQHSSGTTGLQKAIVLSHQAVLKHVRNYSRSIALSPTDKVVSWLPLYHDMGLIAAFHLPLAFGIPSVQLDPFEWIQAPVLMLEAISSEGGTMAWMPNFAFNLMAERIHGEDLEDIRLDSVRLLVNCSEPVRAMSHQKFAARFGPLGLNPASLSACYAMAETTFAVTQSTAGVRAPTRLASRAGLSTGRYVPATEGEIASECVCSGSPISGCELRIVDERGSAVADGIVGEILIRSVSMFDGYRNDPEKTAQVLRDGWYSSGDYGFALDGQYFVIGRKKDIIIVAGKNLYPEDIEDALVGVEGVVPGRVVAYGAEDENAGTEQVCVVAETPCTTEADLSSLRLRIKQAAMAIDVTISRVNLVPPRWIIKSSSGKPSRSANRQRALQEFHTQGAS